MGDLTITSDNFLKYFKINNNNFKILKSVREEVSKFKTIHRDFVNEIGNYSGQEQVDLVFEFQAFMREEVIQAQKRVSRINNFTFMGDAMANEAGHIANLTNQLAAALFEVRTMALGYQSQSGISDLRKCPHCCQVWAKLEGCDGATTCGNKPSDFDGRSSVFANFQFSFDGMKLQITRAGTRCSASASCSSGGNAGCGRPIAWRDMSPVQVPAEFNVSTIVTTDDLSLIPERKKRSWTSYYEGVEAKMGKLAKTLL